ncbi:MAG: RluA family pseudouridine synthase [Deltaproteobacteria bacterium]|nr:RluA family pseudouridine synthase [Deltaproteobacteria bacterium]
MTPLIVRVPESARGARLDKFLAATTDLSRSRIQQLIAEGHVTIAGAAAKASSVLHGGETVQVVVPAPVPVRVESEDIPLTVVYEDADVCVIDKPPGLTVHPSDTQRSGTLVNALLHRVRDLSGIGGELRPGIVHRLDKNTSGLVIIAKHDRAHQHLAAAFAERRVEKIYLAWALGVVPERGEWTGTIGRHPVDRKRFSTKSKSGKAAHTKYVRRALLQGIVSELEVTLLTGRTHQIRVHASDAGHPLVGDTIYGADKALKKVKDARVRDVIAAFSRQALHAHRLTLVLPNGRETTFVAEVPDDLRELRRTLAETVLRN